MRRSPKPTYPSKRNTPLAGPIHSATSASERHLCRSLRRNEGPVNALCHETRACLSVLHETYQRKGPKGRFIKKARLFIPHYFSFC